MPALHMLSMDCACLALNSTSLLPNLDCLRLRVRVECGNQLLDLSWLKLQRVGKLDLCLDLPAWNAEVTERAVLELQQIQVSCLHVIVDHFSLETQQIWGACYTACDHFHLDSARQPDIVHAMPLCEQVTITSSACSWLDSDRIWKGPCTLIILWQALARPGKFCIRVQSRTQLVQVIGCSDLKLDSPGPWQLVIHAHGGVEGLPASRPTDDPAMYFLQNAAADAVGWENENLESMAMW